MVVKAFGLRSVNVEGWVQPLSLEQTATLLNRIKEQTKTGMHKSVVANYLEFIGEFNVLEDRAGETHFHLKPPSKKPIFTLHFPIK